MSINQDFPNTGFVRAKPIAKFLGIGLSTWWLWVREDRTPKPIKLGNRTTVWRADEIHKLADELSNMAGVA